MVSVSFQGINAAGGWKRLPTGRHHWPVVSISLWLDMQNMSWFFSPSRCLKHNTFFNPIYTLFQLTQIPAKY